MSVTQERSDDGTVATWWLDRPEARNAVNFEMWESLRDAALEANRDPQLRVVVIRGRGQHFSAGADIASLGRSLAADHDGSTYRAVNLEAERALATLRVPTVAAIEGFCVGGGVQIALACDLRIATDTATFAESFVKVGIVAGDGGAWFLPRVIGMARAAEMSFTGEPIDAQTALNWGLVSRVVPAADLLSTAHTLARKMAVNSPSVMRMTKRLLREGQTSSLSNLLELSAAYQAIAHKTPEHAVIIKDFMDKKAARKAQKG